MKRKIIVSKKRQAPGVGTSDHGLDDWVEDQLDDDGYADAERVETVPGYSRSSPLATETDIQAKVEHHIDRQSQLWGTVLPLVQFIYIGAFSVWLLWNAYTHPDDWILEKGSVVGTTLLAGPGWIAFILALLLCPSLWTRITASYCFMLCGWLWGASLWAVAAGICCLLWGKVGLTIGLLFGGIGVIPVGFGAGLFKGEWAALAILIGNGLLVWLARGLSIWAMHSAIRGFDKKALL